MKLAMEVLAVETDWMRVTGSSTTRGGRGATMGRVVVDVPPSQGKAYYVGRRVAIQVEPR